MNAEIVHHLPGRLRLSLPALRRNHTLAGRLADQLGAVAGIHSVTANILSGRVLILYEPDEISQREVIELISKVPQKPDASPALSRAAATEAGLSPVRQAEYSVAAPMVYTLLTGGVLSVLVIKRLIIGRSPLASSRHIFNLAALTTMVSGYPILQRGLAQFARKSRLNPELLISAATLLLLIMRESISGLSVLWIVHLNNLFHSIMQARARHTIKQILRQKQLAVRRLGAGQPIAETPAAGLNAGDAAGEGADGRGIADKSLSYQAVNGYSDKLIALAVGIAATVFLLTRDCNRSLAVLLAGCPAAVALSSQAADGMALANAANKGILAKNGWNLRAAGQVDTVLLADTGALTAASQLDKTIATLRAAGIDNIGLISGGTLDSAETPTGGLGLDCCWSAALAQDKLAVVRKLQRQGRKVMLAGEGNNDAQALAAADVGIALGKAGSNSAIAAADIIITEDDPHKIVETVKISRQTEDVVRQNLSFTVGLNALGVAAAAANLISPVTAALLQHVATLGVVTNSTRLLSNTKSHIFSRQKDGRPKQPMFGADSYAALPQLDLQRFNNPPERPGAGGNSAGTPALPFPFGVGTEQLNSAGQVDPGCWHVYPGERICNYWQTSPILGLSEQEAALRRHTNGLNLLTADKKQSFWSRLKGQFKDFMVQVLLGAAGLSVFIGKTRDAALTLAIVAANAFLGAAQESRAEQSIEALRKLAAPMARVVRNGRPARVKAQALVPGDLIILEAGDKVPADARLITASHFEVEEASLTGETLPVRKNPHFTGTANLVLGDRKNMVFMGTSVTRGRATAVVVATGMKTEMGRIAAMIQTNKPETTPLQCRLEELGKYLVYGCLGAAGIIFAAGLLRGQSLLNMLQTAASLAVAAIPEGLAAIVVIALAMGVQRMAKRKVVIRKLASLETLGCANVICSDKTGTLTKNEMTVRLVYTPDKIWQISGEGYLPKGEFSCDGRTLSPSVDAALMQALLAGALCNNAKLYCEKGGRSQERIVYLEEHRQGCWKIHGDPTEGALLVAAAKAGLNPHILETSYTRVKELPFESERRMMSVICGHRDKTLYSKGAPDAVLAACSRYLRDGQVWPLDEEMRGKIVSISEQMADKALRVLATAYRPFGGDIEDCAEEKLETDLIFCGLVGMIDPPRPEVAAAIGRCRQAGIKVVMITGDHPKTAQAIARELGLLANREKVLVGQQLDQLSDQELAQAVEEISVYARTTPHHKLKIVKALKQKGYVVAMTGDGVNDAPAVKMADIGIAMGLMGTDVTKEAACMTLSDDNFATIVGAIEEGRSIYANIRKAIRYLVATNIGEVILMLLAVVFGLPLPLLPMQLLWINLVGDGLPAVALVNDPPAQDVMQRRPCSANDNVLAGGLGRKVVSRGLVIGLVSLGLYAAVLAATGSLAVARTLVVAQLSISQFFHIFDCRIEKHTGKVGLLSNPALVGAVSLSMLMVAAVIHWPVLQPVFGTVALSPAHWLLALAAAGATSAVDLGLEKLFDRLEVIALMRNRPPCTHVYGAAHI